MTCNIFNGIFNTFANGVIISSAFVCLSVGRIAQKLLNRFHEIRWKLLYKILSKSIYDTKYKFLGKSISNTNIKYFILLSAPSGYRFVSRCICVRIVKTLLPAASADELELSINTVMFLFS